MTKVRNSLLAALLMCSTELCIAAGAAHHAAPVLPSDQIKADRTALFDLEPFHGELFAVGERGVVMRSADGGKTWRGRQAPTSRTLVRLLPIDQNTAIAVGHGGTLVRTADGGHSWRKIVVGAVGDDSLLGALRLSSGRLIAYGAYGLYIQSDDQGKTWRRRKILGEDFQWHISDVIEVGRTLYLSGEAGTLAISADRGETWTPLPSPYEGSFFGLLALRNGALLAYGMRGHVFRSEDRGATWQAVPLGSQSALNGGTVSADGRIVLTGNNGLLAVSSDGGRSFKLRTMPEGTPLAKALYVPDGALVYVGYLATGRIPPESTGAHHE